MAKNIVLFCGGTGAASISQALAKEDVNLTLLINGFDDGKSTGEIRKLVPGMLGPSDFRKNIARHSYFEHAHLLEKRIESIDDEWQGITTPCWSEDVVKWREEIIKFAKHNVPLSGARMEEMTIGNLLFAGCYLTDGNGHFNRTVGIMNDTFLPPATHNVRVINVTNGWNVHLRAKRRDGVISDEGQISTYSASPIERLYFEGGQYPEIGESARDAIIKADLIVYCPGTQHSSLLPSYMVKGVSAAIYASNARKVYIANARLDNDIYCENPSVSDLVDKFYFAMIGKKNPTQLIKEKMINLILVSGSLAIGDSLRTEYYNKSSLVQIGEFSARGLHNGPNVVKQLMAQFSCCLTA